MARESLLGKAGGPLPNWIEIPDCDEAGCTVYNGVPVDMTGEIMSLYSAEALTTKLKAFLSIIELPLELPEDIVDGCNAIDGGCPVAAGETRGITANFVVDSTFDNINPDIELSITNETDDLVMCVRTSVTLRNQ